VPITPGEHADILRAVGRLLDRVAAYDVEITNHEAFLTVAWQSLGKNGDRRNYQDHNLDELRREGHQARSGAGREPRSGFAELLRTLGQDLDSLQAEFSQIVQRANGFHLSGVIGGRYLQQTYRTTVLLHASWQRRQDRRTGHPIGLEPSVGPAPLRAEGVLPRYDHGLDDGPLSRRLR
jgi:hypothetical protein